MESDSCNACIASHVSLSCLYLFATRYNFINKITVLENRQGVSLMQESK